ncbi:hypothetical protein AEGHOMDF_2339 [Methylobacterium soli]|nr:hypothetical protein AEGHOMDF_2339 [Methylobacterium soli]
MRRAVVQRLRREGGGKAQHAGNRVLGPVRIGHVALAPVDRELAGERAAPADLDHLAEAARVGRLAEQAMVEALAAGTRPIQELHGAVDRRPLLVAGDQEADRAAEIRAAPRDEFEGARQHAGDAALHVGGAAPVEKPILHRSGEGTVPPRRDGARRHHVGMAGE